MASTSVYHLGTLNILYSTTLILPHRGGLDSIRRCCFDGDDGDDNDDNDGGYIVLTPLPEYIL